MNEIRTNIAFAQRKDQWFSELGFSIVYIVVLWYLIIFTWKFLKRTVYMAFLTIMAPLVGLTYPIDKLGGGSSQSFNLWFKEYTFNLLIQPIDLLLYTIIISTAMDIVEINFIYAIVAIGFLLQAEKFIKKMFGLGAEGGAGKGGFAAGAAFGSIMSSMQSGSRALTGAISSSGEDNPEKEKPTKVRKADANAPKDLDAFKQDSQKAINSGNENSGTSEGNNTGNKMKIPFLGNLLNQSQEDKTKKRFKRAQKKAEKNPNGPGATQLFMQGEQNREKRKIRRAKIKEGAKNVARRYVNKKNGMKVAKLAAMGVGAATFGMIGLSAGLAQDGYDDVLKYGLAGVAGGALLGREAVKQGEAVKNGVKDVAETTQKAYLGKEYNEKLNEKLDKEWYNSSETKELFRTKYGDEWKEKREEALELRKLGITDQSDIEKAIKLKKDYPELSIQQAGNAVNFANNVTSRKELMKEGGEEKVYNQMLNMLGGDKSAADKAMKSVKKVLNIPTESSEGEESSEDKD